MYKITSHFMEKESFRSGSGHTGIDLAMKDHTPLRSIQDGVVEKVLHLKNNVGNAVIVKWDNGMEAIYGHMSEVSVRVGQKVEVGSLLGFSGNSGSVMGQNGGYHLHFGLKENGEFIDPYPYIDLIQNMNNPSKLMALTNHSQEIGMSLNGMFDHVSSNIYQNLLESLKVHFIHLINLIDCTMFIQYFQDFFKFFF